MYLRLTLKIWVVVIMKALTCLIAVGFFAIAATFPGTATADDQDTCRNERGPVAIDACTRLIGSGRYKKKDVAAFYNSRGIKRRLENDLDGAIADYTQSIALDPLSLTYSNRGNSKRLKNDLNGAIADFSEALRVNPKYAPGYANRALVKDENKDIEGAIADLNRAIQLETNYTSAYTNRGLIYERKGDLQRARADFTKAISLPEGTYTDGRWTREKAQERLNKMPQ
jgi:tetratricopeptide (TPR) repeat protein